MGNHQIVVNFPLGKKNAMAWAINDKTKGVLYGESRRDEDNQADCTLALKYKVVEIKSDNLVGEPMTIGSYKPRSAKITNGSADEPEISRYLTSRFRETITGVRNIGDDKGQEKHDHMVRLATAFQVSSPEPAVTTVEDSDSQASESSE